MLEVHEHLFFIYIRKVTSFLKSNRLVNSGKQLNNEFHDIKEQEQEQ